MFKEFNFLNNNVSRELKKKKTVNLKIIIKYLNADVMKHLREIKFNKIQQKINFHIQNDFIIFDNYDLKMSHLNTTNFNFFKITAVRSLRSENLALCICSIKNAEFLSRFSVIWFKVYDQNAMMQKKSYEILMHYVCLKYLKLDSKKCQKFKKNFVSVNAFHLKKLKNQKNIKYIE